MQIACALDVWETKTNACSLCPVGSDGLYILRRPRISCWQELPHVLDPVDCLEPAMPRLLQCFEQVWFGVFPLSRVFQPHPSEHSESMQPLGSEVQTLLLPQPSKTARTRCDALGELLLYTKDLAK